MAKRKPLNQVAYEAARRHEIKFNPDAAEEWVEWEETEDEDRKLWSAVSKAVAKRVRHHQQK